MSTGKGYEKKKPLWTISYELKIAVNTKTFLLSTGKRDEKSERACTCCSEFKNFVQLENVSVARQNKNFKSYKTVFLSTEKEMKKRKRFVISS